MNLRPCDRQLFTRTVSPSPPSLRVHTLSSVLTYIVRELLPVRTGTDPPPPPIHSFILKYLVAGLPTYTPLEHD